MQYYIKPDSITLRTIFLRVKLKIGKKKYEAIARVARGQNRCKPLIWRGERPDKITKEKENAIIEECIKVGNNC